MDLDHPAVYRMYLEPRGERVPVFALIAALYCDSVEGVYPERRNIGIPDFAKDYGFDVGQVESIFNCDPHHVDNAAVMRVVEGGQRASAFAQLQEEGWRVDRLVVDRDPLPLPELARPALANSGLGAELAVAFDLSQHGWQVTYRGSQAGVGYDLEAQRDDVCLHVEVKSSIGFTTPELRESEWSAAQEHGDSFILAIVDFYGSEQRIIWYVRDPASVSVPIESATTIYRMRRADIEQVRTEADFL